MAKEASRLTALLKRIEADETLMTRRKNALTALRNERKACPQCKTLPEVVFVPPKEEKIRELERVVEQRPVTPMMHNLVLDIVKGRHVLSQCACNLQAQLRYPPRMGLSIPPEFSSPTARFRYFTVRKENRAAFQYVENWTQLYVNGDSSTPPPSLCGPIGTGKTRLMYTILNEIEYWTANRNWKIYQSESKKISEKKSDFNLSPPYRKVTSRLISMPRFSEEIKSRISFRRDLAQFRAELMKLDILVIDDIGAENITDFILEEMYLLVNERIEQRKTMMVSCNFDLEQMGEWLGDRIRSRIEGACEILTLGGPDMRLELKNRRANG